MSWVIYRPYSSPFARSVAWPPLETLSLRPVYLPLANSVFSGLGSMGRYIRYRSLMCSSSREVTPWFWLRQPRVRGFVHVHMTCAHECVSGGGERGSIRVPAPTRYDQKETTLDQCEITGVNGVDNHLSHRNALPLSVTTGTHCHVGLQW